MKAGRTNIDINTRIRVKELKGEDKVLSGLTGQITHPFAFGESGDGWIGIYLDNGLECPYGDKFNLKVNEIEII